MHTRCIRPYEEEAACHAKKHSCLFRLRQDKQFPAPMDIPGRNRSMAAMGDQEIIIESSYGICQSNKIMERKRGILIMWNAPFFV